MGVIMIDKKKKNYLKEKYKNLESIKILKSLKKYGKVCINTETLETYLIGVKHYG
jgi:hypothetical protein